MRYTIKISYSTGDSFNTYDTQDELGITWTNLDRAKEALARIKERHIAEDANSRFSLWDMRNPGKEPPKIEDTAGYTTEGYNRILLPLDDGTDQPHSMFWKGCFESLKLAEIVQVIDDDNDMVFDPFVHRN